MTPDDLLKLMFVLDGQFVPQSARYSCTLSSVKGLEDTTAILELGRGSTSTPHVLADGPRASSPSWSPIGTKLAYLQGINGVTQVVIAEADGARPRQLTSFPQGVSGGLTWSPDALNLAFSAPASDLPGPTAAHYRVTRRRYRMKGVGLVQFGKNDLHVLNIPTGRITRLTDDTLDNRHPLWSPDGESILYFAYSGPDPGTFHSTLRIVDHQGSVRDLAPGWGHVEGIAWLPGSKAIALIGRSRGHYIGRKRDLWVLSLDGSEPACRTRGTTVDFGGQVTYDMPVFWEDQPTAIFTDESGDHAFVTGQTGGETQVYSVALEGPQNWVQVTLGSHSCVLQDYSDGVLLYVKSTMTQPTILTELSTLDGVERTVWNPNEDLIDASALPEAQALRVTSRDGAEVEGWVMIPKSSRGPYPTILNIHGGPHEAYGHRFVADFHLLAGAGYAVAFFNQRGSTGYGDAFAEAIRADWGNLDYWDLMAGIDKLVERGIADPERLGLYGLSGGGYLTCWIITHTDRFSAAVAENPVTNWVSFYGTSDVGPAFCRAEFDADPQERHEELYRMSPIAHAKRCTTPTLLIVGDQDCRCPPGQAEEFYASLQETGCRVEMLRFPGGGHTASWDGLPAYRMAQNAALLDWFGKHLRR